LLIQTLNQNAIEVEATDLAAANKKSVIRVLHVDDDPSILEISKDIMLHMNSNFEFDSACCVAEAFKKLATGHYDVVISDYEMPQKDGLQFLKELKQQKNEIPFILFTGRGREEVAIQALNLGVDRYHDKQGSPETVYGELAYSIKAVAEQGKAKKALLESEEKYRALIQQSTQGLLLSQGAIPHIVFANPAMEKITGYSVQELTSFSFQQVQGLIHPDDRDLFFGRFKERLEGKPTPTQYVTRGIKKDGTIVWLELSSTLIQYDGQPCIQAMFADITERKKTEETLAKNEARYRELAKFLPEIVFEADTEGKITFFNQKAFEITGFTREELKKGVKMQSFVVPEDRERAIQNLNKTMNKDEHEVSEYEILKKDGSISPAIVRTAPIISENKVAGVRGIVIDITDRKKMEEKNNLLASIVESSDDAIISKNLDGIITSWNRGAEQIYGYKAEEVLEKSIQILAPPDHRNEISQILKRINAGEQMKHYETRRIRKNGLEIYVSLTVSPIKNEAGLIVGASTVARDISERKKNELELKQYNEILERVGEGIDAGLAVINRDYRVVWANKRLVDLGVAPDKKCYETFNNLGIVCPDCGVERIFENNAPLDIHEYKTVNSKGETSWVELRVTPLKDKMGNVTSALELAVPITERKKAEEKISWLASFPMLNPNPILEVSFEGNISYLNSATEAIFPDLKKAGLSHPLFSGWNDLLATFRNKKMQTLGRNIKINDNWFHQQFNVHIETQQVRVYVTNITEAKLAEKALLENEAKFRIYVENSPVAVFVANTEGKYEYVNEAASKLLGYSTKELIEMSIQQVTFVGEAKVFSEIKNTGNSAGETVLRSKDGLPVFVILNSARLPDGKLMAFCENITERKKNEEILRESIHKNELIKEKLSVVGSLTRHDVGNKLMVAKSNIYLLKKQIGDNPKLAQYLDSIDSAIKSSDAMFEFSRLYERIGVEKLSKENVFECFNQAVALMSNLGSVKVANECQGLEVMADSLLKQLFYNFIDNSLKHGEKVTQIRLHYTEDGDGVKLFYVDNGVGVPEANKPKLFKVGFSTGKGSGLGLYLIKKMMDVYGWKIEENGESGKVAKFTITIPKLSKNGKENYQIAK